MKLKLSQEAIDDLLHIVEHFDRERGVPHNYNDLECTLKTVVAEIVITDTVSEVSCPEIYIISPKKPPV